MRCLLSLLVVFLYLSPAYAQYSAVHATARSVALARSNVATPFNALDANCALVHDSSIDKIEVMYAPLPAGLDQTFELGLSAAYGFGPVDAVGFGFQRLQYSDVYSEQDVGLQYAHRFLLDSTRSVAAGIRVHYLTEDFGVRYLPSNNLLLDLGATVQAFKNISFGFAFDNLVTLYRNQDSIPLTALAGVTYTPTEDFSLHVASVFPTAGTTYATFGAEYLLEHFLFVRAGYQTVTNELSAGLGFVSTQDLASDAFEINFAIVRHPTLGNTLSFSVGYRL